MGALISLVEDEESANGASWHNYGYGKACRLSSEDNSSDAMGTIQLHENVGSVIACKNLCEAYDLCIGVEYQTETGHCELWTQPIGYTVPKEAYVCMTLAHNPAAFPVAPGVSPKHKTKETSSPARIIETQQEEMSTHKDTTSPEEDKEETEEAEENAETEEMEEEEALTEEPEEEVSEESKDEVPWEDSVGDSKVSTLQKVRRKVSMKEQEE